MVRLKRTKKRLRNYSDWFATSNTPRIFYSEVLVTKSKRAQRILRKNNLDN